MKIFICFGTRPEAIKMAPVILELKRKNISHKICVTGQHREMLDQMLDLFKIQPDYDLNLMKAGQSLNHLSSEIFKNIDKVLKVEKPDVVLVQGDTTTSNIIAQAAYHLKINVGHIEAGLRTYRKYAPFPEEINRQIISRIASWHFAPTNKAVEHLKNEGIAEKTIFNTGNTVVDTLEYILSTMNKPQWLEARLERSSGFEKMILVTGHRRENFGKGIQELCEALLELSGNEKLLIIFPVHLNPLVKESVTDLLKDKSNIILLSPLNYDEMIWLMGQSDLIISDSGGIQEEAPALKKSVIITRKETERMEAVEAGFNYIAGPVKDKIVEIARNLLNNPQRLDELENPFGDGKAAKRILDILSRPD